VRCNREREYEQTDFRVGTSCGRFSSEHNSGNKNTDSSAITKLGPLLARHFNIDSLSMKSSTDCFWTKMRAMSRATISRHVAFDVFICFRRMLHWIENYECLVLAFPAIWISFLIDFYDIL
jgi:hypothetical protein